MKFKNIILTVMLLLSLTIPIYSASYYYYENFNGAMGAEWTNDLDYGRHGIVFPPCGNSVQQFNAGELQFTLDPYDGCGDYGYDGWWSSKAVFNTNRFNATNIQPFGVEAIRTYCDLDVNTAGGQPGDARKRGQTGFWLYVDDISDKTVEWSIFANFVEFADHIGDYTSDMRQKIICYSGVETIFDLTQVIRPDGRVIDISSVGNWDYNLLGAGSTPNNNDISFRMTHDGNYISFYMNVNPGNANANGFPDEYCYLGKKLVEWNKNIQFMFNHEQLCASFYPAGNNQVQDVNWDNLLVKSASDSSKQSVTPTSVTVSTGIKNITLILTNTITNQPGKINAGINVITITKPSVFKWPSALDITNYITVRADYNDDGTVETLTTVKYYPLVVSATNYPITNRCAIVTNGDELKIILGAQITNMSVPSRENIFIDMKFIITNYFSQAEFTSTVEAVQFDSMSTNKKGKYSTCGPQKTTGSAIIVPSKGPSEGLSSITPNFIVQGNDSYSFTYYLKSTNQYLEDIKQAAILIPSVFVVKTNSIDSFLIVSNDSTYIIITTNSAIAGTNNIILIDYEAAGSPLSASGDMDIITFDTYGNSEKGTHQWKCWVDGDAVDGLSNPTATNDTFPSQKVMVSGAGPSVAGGITKPVNADPVFLFNTITKNTLEFYLENRAPGTETDNKIQTAVIYIPDVFTNIVILGSTKIANTYIKEGAVSNMSTITLYYGTGGNKIGPDYDNDTVTFVTWHNQPAMSGTTNFGFSAVVDNSNATGLQPLKITLITNIEITDPKPAGAVTVTPTDVVYTSDATNYFTNRIENSAPSGDILYAWITIPTNYFTLVTNIQSSRISSTYIKLSNNVIFFDYSTNAGDNPIIPGQRDNITFTLVDKITNIDTADSAVITSRVGNETKTNNTADKDIDETRTVYFIPQEARVKSFTKTKLFLSSVTTFTMVYAVSNYGDQGNKVKKVRIYFTNTSVDFDATNIFSQFPTAVVTKEIVGAGPIVFLDYATEDFNSSQKDEITIIGDYTTPGVENFYNIPSRVTVNTDYMVPTEIKSGDNVNLFFEIPKPSVDVYVTPNIIFTTTGKEINYLNYIISNTGMGNNNIRRAEIIVPGLYLTNVTVKTSTFINNPVNITNKADKLIISYISDGSNVLKPGDKDIITLAVTNELSKITNVNFICYVYNKDKTNTGDVKTSWSINVDIVDQPFISISPNSNFTTDVTNIYTFIIQNGTNYNGRDIYRARVLINTQYYIAASVDSYNHDFSGISANSNINGTNYRWIKYETVQLSPGNNDEFTLKIADKIVSTNRVFWQAEIDYDDKAGFRPAKTLNPDDAKVKFMIPQTKAESYVLPNEIADQNTETVFSYHLTNTGKPGNDITMIEISIPITVFTDITFLSNKINANITFKTSGGGLKEKLIVNYKTSNNSLQSGVKDIIYFKCYDEVDTGGPTSYTLYCKAANTVDTNFSGPTTVVADEKNGMSRKVQFIIAEFSAEGYILSGSPINTITVTNTIKYYIRNSSGLVNNNIDRVRIEIPTNYFSTNIVAISSPKFPIIIRTGNIIDLNYVGVGQSIQKLGTDEVSITVIDTWTNGEITNVKWPIKAQFNTSFPTYVSMVEPGGNNFQSVDFEIPDISVIGTLLTSTLLGSTNTNIDTSRIIQYRVMNTGDFYNKLNKAVLTLPVVLSNTLVGNAVSSWLGGSVSNYFNGSNHVIVIDYEGAGNLLAGQNTDIITITVTNFKITGNEYDNYLSFCVSNISTNECDYLSKFDIRDVSGLTIQAYLENEDSQFIYTLDKSANLVYIIHNLSALNSGNDVTKAVIDFNWSLFPQARLAGITNIIPGTTITSNATNIILDYTTGDLLKPNDKDYIYLSFNYDISNQTNMVMACTADVSGMPVITEPDPLQSQVLRIEVAYWGKVTGLLFPNKPQTTLKIFKSGTYTNATNFLGAEVFNSTVIESNDGMENGRFVIDRLPPGTYDIQFENAPDYETDKYLISIVVESNKVTNVGVIMLQHAKINFTNENNEVYIYCFDDQGKSYVYFPDESASAVKDFFLDIDITNADSGHISAASGSDTINPPNDLSQIKIFDFDLRDVSGNPIDEIEIDAPVTIVLHYDNTELSNLTRGSMVKNDLAIYYYKENTKEWVKNGGVQNIKWGTNTVQIQVSYLHSTYAIFSSKKGEVVKIYEGLRIWPNPFTPGRGGVIYENLKISCIFESPVTGFKFKVYDLVGRVIVTKEYMGTYNQCEIYWDGKDDEGYWVKTGVYIFQIETDSEYYRGKVGVLR